jgi:hypothetical protein
MQLCAAIVTGMPVYEATGIETKKAELRERVTQCLCALTNCLYMGCYSLGETFRISYIALLNANSGLLTEEYKAMQYMQQYLPGVKPLSLAVWIDKLLDGHENQREIEFKWMLN